MQPTPLDSRSNRSRAAGEASNIRLVLDAEPQDSIGADLRIARERRHLSLDDIARATKIRVVTLKAIERDAFEDLPSGIFRRGLLRAYAKQVGLDPEEIVARYVAEFEPGTKANAVAGRAERSVEETVHEEPNLSRELEPDDSDRPGRHQLLVGTLLVIALAGYVSFVRWHERAQPTPSANTSSGAAAVTPAAGASNRVEASRNANDAAVATGGSSSVVHINLATEAPCWVTAIADGNRVIYRLMQAGETAAFEAHERIVLRVGDPAVLAYSINGRRGRPIGPAGTAVTVAVTPENYQQFLQ